MVLPGFILGHAPLAVQILFFGALLSAIKSCASATLLAPSVTFTENILRPLRPDIGDAQLLRTMRIVTLVFTLLVTLYAVNSEASIFEMVENAYQVTLVAAFVPLVFGIFWRRATNQGALAAIFLGAGVWVACLLGAPEDAVLPPQIAGLLASLAGMVAGSLMPQFLPHDPAVHERLKSGQMAETIPGS
jgi:Na+/proline symporter